MTSPGLLAFPKLADSEPPGNRGRGEVEDHGDDLVDHVRGDDGVHGLQAEALQEGVGLEIHDRGQDGKVDRQGRPDNPPEEVDQGEQNGDGHGQPDVIL